MSQNVTLAIPQHDPAGESLSKSQRLFPQLQSLFAHIVADVSPETHASVKEMLRKLHHYGRE